MTPKDIDGLLIRWGDRLFYPANRTVYPPPDTKLRSSHAGRLRKRIEATIRGRTPQVMVKITGGGRGMTAIAAHLSYISKRGKLELEDDRGDRHQGGRAVRDLVEEWRHAGSLIADEDGRRKEAFNLILSMPSGTDAECVKKAVAEFARQEFSDHRYLMVFHGHQNNPHVHLCVRAESLSGVRLNPRKSDLHRWRETFAERLRGWGIEAEATRQATRGQTRNYDKLWQQKAREDGRLRKERPAHKSGGRSALTRKDALASWAELAKCLARSGEARDRELAVAIVSFVREMPAWQAKAAREQLVRDRNLHGQPVSPSKERER